MDQGGRNAVSTRRLIVAVALALAIAPVALAAGTAKQPALQVSVVGRLPFPERGYIIDLPKGAVISPKQVHVSENGIGIGNFTFQPLAASGVRYGAILAIDASDSMAGKPEAAAVSAARTFVDKRGANQEIGVLTFNGAVNVVQALTVDAGSLHNALAKSPTLAYGTHIFDGLSQSLQLLAHEKVSAGSVVLLSDGKDVGSSTSLKSVVAAAQAQHVRIFTVGLRSGAFDGTTLRSIAAQTRGSYAEATSASQLGAIYSSLSSKLASEYLLQYRSNAAPSSTVDVSIALDNVGATTSTYDAPKPSELPPYHRPFVRRFFLSGWSLALLALVVAGLLAFAVRLTLEAVRSRVVARVRAFSSEPEPDRSKTTEAKRDEWRKRAARARVSSSSAARGWLGKLDEQLDIGRIRVSPMTIAVVTAVTTLLVVVLLAAVSPLFAVLGLGTPLLTRTWIHWKVKKVRDAFADQLPPNLQVLASALRAGYTLLGALVATVDNASEPSRSELGRAVADERLGMPLEEAIRRVARRMDSRDLDQVALLAELVRTTGGNAAEVLDVIVATVRERADIRRLVQTLTTQGRLARWILTALPIVTGLAFWALQPDIVGPMWRSTGGQFALLIAAIMVAAGSLIIQRIIEIEV
jgi:tight adherence protein B